MIRPMLSWEKIVSDISNVNIKLKVYPNRFLQKYLLKHLHLIMLYQFILFGVHYKMLLRILIKLKLILIFQKEFIF